MTKLVNRLIIILIMIVLLPITVFAEGNITVSPSSITIEEGSSKTINISAYNTIGDVSIRSNNSEVANVSTNEWTTGMVEEKQTKTGTIEVKGLKPGTAVITFTIDAATYDEEELSGQTRTVNVTVVQKPQNNPTPNTQPPANNTTPPPVNNNTNTNSNSNTNNNTTNNTTNNTNTNTNNNQENNKSTNNKIKSIKVEGYTLTKIDDNNYTLSVLDSVSSIDIKVEAEDSKSKIDGIGKHELNSGENNIEVIVTSESGLQNKINIKITRKEDITLEDLSELLDKDNITDINVKINSNDKLSSNLINKIKSSNKKVFLNYVDENNKPLYTWIIDGNKIKEVDSLETGISFESSKKKEISKLSNYADGIIISTNQNGNIIEGITLKLNVSNKYKDNDELNIYYYDKSNNELKLVKEKIKVKDGYIEFYPEKGKDYLVTMSNITKPNNDKNNSNDLYKNITLTAILLMLIVLVILLVLNMKNKNKNA